MPGDRCHCAGAGHLFSQFWLDEPGDAFSWATALASFVGVLVWPDRVLAQVLQTLAYRYGSTHRIAPFSYAALVVSIGVGWLVFRAVPDAWSILGMSIIAAAGVAMVLRR